MHYIHIHCSKVACIIYTSTEKWHALYTLPLLKSVMHYVHFHCSKVAVHITHLGLRSSGMLFCLFHRNTLLYHQTRRHLLRRYKKSLLRKRNKLMRCGQVNKADDLTAKIGRLISDKRQSLLSKVGVKCTKQ